MADQVQTNAIYSEPKSDQVQTIKENQNHRGISRKVNEELIMARNQLKEKTKDSRGNGLMEQVKKLVGSCGAVVDVASIFFQNTCCGETTEDYQVDNFPLQNNNGSRTKRRQGATLEFSARAGFEDDDVSAISAHTLEEMERKNMLNHARQLNAVDLENAPRDVEAPPPAGLEKPKISKKNPVFKNPYPFDTEASAGTEDISIGVSTSGSASSEEKDAKKK
jgi:hypothetical protein